MSSGLLKDKQRKALWEVVAMGQWSGIPGLKPSRAERKAAKWAFRTLNEHGIPKP